MEMIKLTIDNKIKKAKQVRRLPGPAAILCKGQALRVFGKNFEDIIKKV